MMFKAAKTGFKVGCKVHPAVGVVAGATAAAGTVVAEKKVKEYLQGDEEVK